MATFKVETKNKVDIDKKPRVYFTCHPEDFEKHFKKICDDIFKTHDCAIYYTEDMTEVIAEDEKQVDLGRNNLFVVPVTFKLLTSPNRAMDEDIPYALKEHIPVLPIMMEPGIDEFYSNPDKFGELQYLNPYSADLTEISYEEKLKKYLESVLISDELAKRVRAAFDAYIFLSYRKKDRKYANELMRLIHSIPECRDIAIWFDEFLTPGESFKENIERILDDCKLFTLLVTPQIIEKVVDENGEERDNYVISTELPLAQKKKEENKKQGKCEGDIVSIKAEDINKSVEKVLKEKKITEFIDARFTDFFKKLFLEAIIRNGIRKSEDSPEHNFLIGLAYLEGIDVEVDRKLAIELIIDAAEAGLVEAMKKLYVIYSDSISAYLDYKKSIKWAAHIVDYYTQKHGEEHRDTLEALRALAFSYRQFDKHQKALELYEKVNVLRCKVLGEEHPDTLTAISDLALSYERLGDYDKAIELGEKAYALRCKVLGEEHPDTLIAISNLALSYERPGDYDKAIELGEKAYALRCKILGEEHPDTLTAISDLALSYGYFGDYDKAIELGEKAYALRCKVLGEEHPDTLLALHNLACSYVDIGKHQNAIKLQEWDYALLCKILGEVHPYTLQALNNLACYYTLICDFQKAHLLYEKLYDKQCKIYGTDHPKTRQTQNILKATYAKL